MFLLVDLYSLLCALLQKQFGFERTLVRLASWIEFGVFVVGSKSVFTGFVRKKKY